MPADQFYFIIIALNFFSFLSILLLLIVIIEHDSSSKKIGEEKTEENYLAKYRQQSQEILNHSVKQANKILTNAELRGIKAVAKGKFTGVLIEKEYEAHISSLEESLKKRFLESLVASEKAYNDFITTLERSIEAHARESQKTLEDEAQRFISQSQNSVNGLVTDVQNKVSIQVEKELVAAKAAIEEYRYRRMKIIDENIIEILEKTLRIALGKKMSLADQSALIYKALEEAKKEHALS